jgi:serpin B
MFQKNKRWNYTRSEELDSQLLELPYLGNDFSLVVILPQQRNGLEKLKSIINYDNMKIAINSMKMTRIEVRLPKFKIEQKYELKSALNQKLNLKVFTNEADLSKIDGSRNLRVTKVLHKVVIEVNERGSEAAAVTAIEISLRSKVINPLVFEADHPFLYLIRDKTNGLIHFIGQITVF